MYPLSNACATKKSSWVEDVFFKSDKLTSGARLAPAILANGREGIAERLAVLILGLFFVGLLFGVLFKGAGVIPDGDLCDLYCA